MESKWLLAEGASQTELFTRLLHEYRDRVNMFLGQVREGILRQSHENYKAS